MLDRNEVRVRAEGPFRGEANHLRAERGEDARHLDLRSGVGSRVHRVQVPLHVLEGLGVGLAARLHDRGVAHTEPEEKSVGVGVDERPRAIRHRHGVARPDVGDTGRDDELVRRRENEAHVSEDLLAPEALRQPDRREPERFDGPRVVASS